MTRKGCPGAVGSAHTPPKEAPRQIKCFWWRRMGSPLWGFLAWRGRLGRGRPEGGTKAGEERTWSLQTLTRKQLKEKISS